MGLGEGRPLAAALVSPGARAFLEVRYRLWPLTNSFPNLNLNGPAPESEPVIRDLFNILKVVSGLRIQVAVIRRSLRKGYGMARAVNWDGSTEACLWAACGRDLSRTVLQ